MSSILFPAILTVFHVKAVIRFYNDVFGLALFDEEYSKDQVWLKRMTNEGIVNVGIGEFNVVFNGELIF